jgi:biotin transport system substrate-specific component
MMKKHKTKELVEIALFAALLCVIAPFTLPVPGSPVPLSLATFGVYLAALLLGAKQGVLCVLVYLLLGMVGLPVFSGFSGGIGVLLGPTGGYLGGYVPCAFLIGWMANAKCFEKAFSGRQFVKNSVAMILGTLVCYAFGTVWFLLVMSDSYTIVQALLVCVVPYIFFDMVKILAAAAVAGPVKRILQSRE